MKYLYEYNEVRKMSIGMFIKEIEKVDGKKISDLTISDLIFHDNKPIYTGCGVYIFKHGRDIFYIGKNSARCFIERIPAHFDIRKGGWFNRLLRLIAIKIFEEDDKSDEVLSRAAKYAIENFEIVLINFMWEDFYGDKSIEILEDFLRMTTYAANAFKGKRHWDFDTRIEEFVDLEKEKKQ